jgi:hypothetical protein
VQALHRHHIWQNHYSNVITYFECHCDKTYIIWCQINVTLYINVVTLHLFACKNKIIYYACICSDSFWLIQCQMDGTQLLECHCAIKAFIKCWGDITFWLKHHGDITVWHYCERNITYWVKHHRGITYYKTIKVMSSSTLDVIGTAITWSGVKLMSHTVMLSHFICLIVKIIISTRYSCIHSDFVYLIQCQMNAT